MKRNRYIINGKFEKLAEKENFTIFTVSPNLLLSTELDGNFILFDSKRGVRYLIDDYDVHDTSEDVEEYGGIMREDLLGLCDIDRIIMSAWRAFDSEDNDVTQEEVYAY